jgi:hypothetical protein
MEPPGEGGGEIEESLAADRSVNKNCARGDKTFSREAKFWEKLTKLFEAMSGKKSFL